jgi:hypothetical protein
MEKPDGELSTKYGRTEIAALKERHPLSAEDIQKSVNGYLSDDRVPTSDDEFVALLKNQHGPRSQAASLRPMKGKKVRGAVRVGHEMSLSSIGKINL